MKVCQLSGGLPGTSTASVDVPVAPKFGGIVGDYAVWIGDLVALIQPLMSHKAVV